MRGTILGVYEGRGVLIGPEGRRYEFPLSEWRSPGAPSAGQSVDFAEEEGAARAVFAAPSAPAGASASVVLGGIGVGCLALGLIVPLLPTLAALILGVIGASKAKTDGDETGLILSRIAWLGALVLLAVGVLVMLMVFSLLGAAGWFALSSGVVNINP